MGMRASLCTNGNQTASGGARKLGQMQVQNQRQNGVTDRSTKNQGKAGLKGMQAALARALMET